VLGAAAPVASAKEIKRSYTWKNGGATCNGVVSADVRSGNVYGHNNALCTISLGQPPAKYITVRVTTPGGLVFRKAAPMTANGQFGGGNVSVFTGNTEAGNYTVCAGFNNTGNADQGITSCTTGPLK
jgi:hypothetical protein